LKENLEKSKMSQRTSYTHCQSPTSQRLNQSFAKECACPSQEEKLKISSPLENKKYPNPQADTDSQESNLTMTRKLNIDNGLQTRWTRTPAGNRRYILLPR